MAHRRRALHMMTDPAATRAYTMRCLEPLVRHLASEPIPDPGAADGPDGPDGGAVEQRGAGRPGAAAAPPAADDRLSMPEAPAAGDGRAGGGGSSSWNCSGGSSGAPAAAPDGAAVRQLAAHAGAGDGPAGGGGLLGSGRGTAAAQEAAAAVVSNTPTGGPPGPLECARRPADAGASVGGAAAHRPPRPTYSSVILGCVRACVRSPGALPLPVRSPSPSPPSPPLLPGL